MSSVSAFRKRYCDRVVRDLPTDLEPDETDALGVLRSKVARAIAQQPAALRGTPAYRHRASFGVPASPPTSRLQSASGARSFHLGIDKPVDRPARSFDGYAASKLAVAAEQQVVEPPVEAGQGVAAGYDAYALGHGGKGGNPDYYTSLSKDPSKGGPQWDQIEAHERAFRVNCDAGPPRLAIFYDRAPALFDRAASSASCPSGLRTLIETEQRRVAAGKTLSKRPQVLGVHWADDGAPIAQAWLAQLPGWDADKHKDRRLSRLTGGRAVLTHVAGEIEYPAILAARPDCRANIRRGFAAYLEHLRNAGDGATDGSILPVALYDHQPDALNDWRNVHCHFLIGTRRAWLGDDDALTFAEHKLDAITRMGAVERLREAFAALANIELERIGAAFHLHPGTYAEMGIAGAEPNKKMFGRATVLERAGVATTTGLSNDVEDWDRRFKRAQQRYDDRRERIASEAASDAAREMLYRAAVLRHEAEQIGLLVGMSVSRGKRTARFAPAYADKAKGASTKHGWRIRAEEARDYLRLIETELVPERAAIVAHRREAGRLERAALDLSASEARAAHDRVRRSAMHRAIDLVIASPLLITERDGVLGIERHDDPAGILAGIDLGGTEAQRRLRSCQAAQMRELAQVRAFARKHGHAALSGAQAYGQTPWLSAAIARWRASPVLEREERERLERAGQHRAALVSRNAGWAMVPDDVEAYLADGRITLLDVETPSSLAHINVPSPPEQAAGFGPEFSLVPRLTPRAQLPERRAEPELVPAWRPGPALPVPASVSVTWRAAGMDAFAADVAGFELVLSAPPRRGVITDGRLADALGADAAWLTKPAIHDRLSAVWLYQQMTRRDLLASRGLPPAAAGKDFHDIYADRLRHQDDQVLALMLDADDHGAAAPRSGVSGARLIRAALAAIDAGEDPSVCRLLADAAIAAPGALALRRLFSDRDDLRLWEASSMRAKGIVRRSGKSGRFQSRPHGELPDYPGRRLR